MSIDSALLYTSTASEVAVIVIVFRRRIFATLPVFSIYLVWTILSDLAGLIAARRSPELYFHAYLVLMPLDSLLQFGVIVELAWSVLRPFRSSLPRGAFFVVAGIIFALGVAVWPLAGISALKGIPRDFQLMFHLVQTFAIIRILFFLVLAAFSQLLAIGWRDRELQVATGLGIYSVASLGAALLHAQMPGADRYHHVDQLVVVSYIVSLIYWAVSFLQQEAPRQEFTPRMQSILLTVSGAARTNRIAVQELRKGNK